jgi:hypothetical protein
MVQPVPFQPRNGTSQAITAPPVLVEVQVSLIVNERLGWLLPVLLLYWRATHSD